MMLCKADFEEIFPALFKPNQRPLAETPVAAKSPACIARWEDDGGRLSDKTRRRKAPVFHTAADGYVVPDRTSFTLAMMPVAAAHSAAWTMLSSFDRLARL